jgi:N-acetylglucosamine-6-phosphate deacetylase
MSTFRCRIPGRTGRFEVSYEAGELQAVEPVEAGSGPDPQLWLTPGLFDIQFNGMFGHDLAADDLTPAMVQQMDAELERRGVLRWCPTICTQSARIVEQSLATIRRTIEEGFAPHVHCIHLEGHYISGEEGYRGVHPPQYIRDPDPSEFDRWQQAAGGRIGLFSLAPERQGALRFIRKLRSEGVRVALVHHHADYPTIRKASAAGADLSSHLINGCVPLINRQHNVIWAQLSLPELWASFIADGYHIPAYTLRALIAAKGFDRSILISDLGHIAGQPDGEYRTSEGTVVVLEQGGLWIKGKGTDLLSGAAKTLERDVEYLASAAGVDIELALLMASRNPARYFGIEREFDLFAGRRGPLALFRWQDNRLSVEALLGNTEVAGPAASASL